MSWVDQLRRESRLLMYHRARCFTAELQHICNHNWVTEKEEDMSLRRHRNALLISVPIVNAFQAGSLARILFQQSPRDMRFENYARAGVRLRHLDVKWSVIILISYPKRLYWCNAGFAYYPNPLSVHLHPFQGMSLQPQSFLDWNAGRADIEYCSSYWGELSHWQCESNSQQAHLTSHSLAPSHNQNTWVHEFNVLCKFQLPRM